MAISFCRLDRSKGERHINMQAQKRTSFVPGGMRSHHNRHADTGDPYDVCMQLPIFFRIRSIVLPQEASEKFGRKRSCRGKAAMSSASVEYKQCKKINASWNIS